MLLEPRALTKYTKRDTIAKFYIENEDTIIWLNSRAIKKQMGYREGRVIASDKQFLQDALSVLKKEDRE